MSAFSATESKPNASQNGKFAFQVILKFEFADLQLLDEVNWEIMERKRGKVRCFLAVSGACQIRPSTYEPNRNACASNSCNHIARESAQRRQNRNQPRNKVHRCQLCKNTRHEAQDNYNSKHFCSVTHSIHLL